MKRSTVLVLGISVALGIAALVPARASAATLTVCPGGCQYTTIAAALAAAANGDTIAVGGGTYAGGVTIDKSVTLLGALLATGAPGTRINGGSPVVTVVPGVSVTISRVIVSGGTQGIPGGGGIANGGTLTLTNSVVSGNSADYFVGGIYNTGTLTVRRTRVQGNVGNVGGVYNDGGGTIVLTQTDVSGNDGIGIYQWSGTLSIEGSRISGNSGTYGAGIYVNQGTASLQQTVVTGNTSLYGRGGGINNSARMTISQSTITGNTAEGPYFGSSGGGIFNDGTLLLTQTVVSGNTAHPTGSFYPSGGGGIGNAGRLTIDSSAIRQNSASYGGGILNYYGGALTVQQSTVTGNTAFIDGGGIYNNNGGAVTLIDNEITNNVPDDCVNC